MSPAEGIAMEALTDLAGIVRREGSVLQRFQAMEDRLHRAARDLEAVPLPAAPSCDCGEAGCQRGVCR